MIPLVTIRINCIEDVNYIGIFESNLIIWFWVSKIILSSSNYTRNCVYRFLQKIICWFFCCVIVFKNRNFRWINTTTMLEVQVVNSSELRSYIIVVRCNNHSWLYCKCIRIIWSVICTTTDSRNQLEYIKLHVRCYFCFWFISK